MEKLTTRTGEYFFNQMTEIERDEFCHEFDSQMYFVHRAGLTFEQWMNKEFKTFEHFLEYSFDFTKSRQAKFSGQKGRAYWFWISIQYNVSQPTGFGG